LNIYDPFIENIHLIRLLNHMKSISGNLVGLLRNTDLFLSHCNAVSVYFPGPTIPSNSFKRIPEIWRKKKAVEKVQQLSRLQDTIWFEAMRDLWRRTLWKKNLGPTRSWVSA